MLWKIILTGGLIFVAYLTLKSRLRGSPIVHEKTLAHLPRMPSRGAAGGLAALVLAVMILGSGWYLWREWEHGNRVMQVQVVNVATGAIVLYEARRRDVEGRVVRTLDGREIRLADAERMILTESSRSR